MYMDHKIKPEIQVSYFLVHKNFYNLKRTLVFLVTITVTVFSFFLCLSSGFSVLPNSYFLYFNSCLFSFLTHSLERKYMFLICNGILAFLAKSSDYFSSVSDSNCTLQQGFDADQIPVSDSTFYDHDVEEEERQGKKEDLSKEDEVLKIKKQEEDQEQENGESQDLIREDGDSDKVVKIKKDEEEEQETEDLIEDGDKEKMNEEEGGGGGGGSEELVSTEELNRRIEEFIRKMKEEIRIEAQQQLITV